MKTTQKWNKLFLLGIIGMVLTFGLVVISCDEVYEYSETVEGVTFKATLTLKSDGKFEMKETGSGTEMTVKGTYTKSGSKVTFKPDGGGEFTGTLDGNKLTVGGTTLTKKSVEGEDDIFYEGQVFDVVFE
ncbi:hypothetical protein FACS1894172_17360 [Spirochaetia bacterium]|nr:hypothetical protein FACS1894164_01710 [Spirochaetia bacterium]GHU35485.1 hypothetical protein FACS1894172_17360 [Spirochaetia bacterium]